MRRLTRDSIWAVALPHATSVSNLSISIVVERPLDLISAAQGV
jgi:hypothetical protein